MSLDETINVDSVVSMPIEDAKLVEKPKKIPRAALLSEGKIVLTHKLDIWTQVRLSVDTLFWKFQKITHPQMKEHLLDTEKAYFKEKIDIETLPINGIIEVWCQIPDSQEYKVTEYKKLK